MSGDGQQHYGRKERREKGLALVWWRRRVVVAAVAAVAGDGAAVPCVLRGPKSLRIRGRPSAAARGSTRTVRRTLRSLLVLVLVCNITRKSSIALSGKSAWQITTRLSG